tara:strand:- start:26 stop:769 length:744 start_codon:yes stop_codon:yes gene_type:complete
MSFLALTTFANAQEPVDEYYSPEEMAASRMMLKKITGGQNHLFLMADKLEYRSAEDGSLAWEAKGWFGGDHEKIYFKSQAEFGFAEDEFHEGDVEVLYSRAIAPFFDAQAGIKQDFSAGPKRTYATIGIMGLAPYWFEIDGSLQMSDKGNIAANFEVEYELLLTQRLILQPIVEITLQLQDVPELGIGSGLSDLETGLRLRYEVKREFAPYVGISWHQSLGQTADFHRMEGHDTSEFSFVAGVRLWY